VLTAQAQAASQWLTQAKTTSPLQAYSLATSPVAQLKASTVALTAAAGIGSAGSAINTEASNLRLENKGIATATGIYVTNAGDMTVAAASTNGNIVIKTANGVDRADGSAAEGGAGGNILVGTVSGLAGITTTGIAGNITLTAGAGGKGGSPTSSGLGSGVAGGKGGAGGGVHVATSIRSAQALNLAAGVGGQVASVTKANSTMIFAVQQALGAQEA
jgi:hypothetical protein